MTDGSGGPDLSELRGRVAVVTGGASGIGRALARALLDEGATVVVADVEKAALDTAVAELSAHGSRAGGAGGTVEGVVTDVSSAPSLEALADHVFAAYGACHLLFNNAGVTSGGGGKPWEQEPNDWYWCFGVNVFGVVHGVLSFVPRMIASGEPGLVVNTSSGDGGFAPVPYASVYASSKAAVSCFTEALAHQLASETDTVRAAVFYPFGGVLRTGLWTASRNRPAELARQRPRDNVPNATVDDWMKSMADAGRPLPVADLDALARAVLAGVKEGRYVIGGDLTDTVALLHQRADHIGRGQLPPTGSEVGA